MKDMIWVANDVLHTRQIYSVDFDTLIRALLGRPPTDEQPWSLSELVKVYGDVFETYPGSTFKKDGRVTLRIIDARKV